MTNKHKVGVVVTCMDCRLHRPEADHYTQLCKALGVDDIYIETEAGPDGAICQDGERCLGAIQNLVIIKEAKQPDIFAVVAHYDCAGHPVDNEEHDQDVVAAADRVSEKVHGEPGKVAALVAYPNESEEGPTWLIKSRNGITLKT